MHIPKRIFRVLTALILAAILLPPASASAGVEPPSIQSGQSEETAALALPDTPQTTEAAKTRALEAYGQLPLSFIPNQGQVDEQVGYYVQSGGQSLWFAADGVTMALPEMTLHLEFLGANPSARLEGGDQLPGIVNYFIGNDPDQWRTNIPTYGRITYRDLWPGVDLTYEGRPGALKSTFTLAPDADPAQIRLAYPAAHSLVVDGQGNLIIRANGEEVRENAPRAWQEIDGRRVPVAVSYQVSGQGYSFTLPEGYDPAYPLVIDPQLVYSTFLGGSGHDYGYGIAADSAGNVYVTGHTESSNFPTTPGAFDTTHDGDYDAFVVKLDAAGSGLLYSTFLGGSNYEAGRALTVDVVGNAYVTGRTMSSNFPTTSGAFDTAHNHGADVYIVKLNPSGSGLLYSTFLGGSHDDGGEAINIDSNGAAYITGYAWSTNFPITVGAFDTTHNGGFDVFAAKLNTSGSDLVYSTFLGGNDNDGGYAITVDGSGAAYATGYAWSTDFPTTVGAFDTTHNGICDAFVVKLNAAGSDLLYATFLGGDDDDDGHAIAVDGDGVAYVAGGTKSTNFPATAGAFSTTHNGNWDAYVVKLNPVGSDLLYATFLGGNDNDDGYSIAVDGSGAAWVTGKTKSTDFPVTPGAFDTTPNDWFDVFVAKLNASGNDLLYATFLGGSDSESGEAIAVDGSESAYIVGYTFSPGFPTTADASDTTHNGFYDAFVAKLDLADDTTPPATITDLAASTGSNPGQVELTWTAPGDDGNTGTAMTYTVRYADSAIVSEFGWAAATDVDGEPTPQIAGSSESMTVSGLTPGQTYYFAIKTQDEVPNISGLSNSPSAMAKESPPWTLMFYMDGDNNLDSNYVAAFNQLESAADNPEVNILVAWDRSANGNSAYYKVQHDTDLDEANPAADYTDNVNRWPKNELRMNDSSTLSDFIQWARTNYPAQYYVLVISNHGTGLNGLATDNGNGSGGDWLRVTEWSSALATATSNGTDKIDVVFADACLMAMIEDAYQIRNYTDYYVASENIGWVTGGSHSGPYDDYVSSIEATTSPRDLATIFANRYAGWLNADHSALPYTISAVDLGQLAPLVSAVNTLASNLNAQMGIYGSQVTNAHTATQKFDSNVNFTLDQNDAYMDLYDFAQNVKSNVPDATIQNAAQSVMDAVTNYVITEAHHTGSHNGTTWNLDNSHGVSIFFPPKASSFYNSTNYDFAVGATWPGSQGASIRPQASDVEWGPMLVTYFNVTQPGGPDTPEPPPLVSPLAPEGSNVYLPIILKDH